MKYFSLLIKPASSLCNMRCRYCFYHDISSMREIPSYGIMTDRNMRKIIDNVFESMEDGDFLSVAFQGGEPTLAGLSYFEKFTGYIEEKNRDIAIRYSIQTNGCAIDDDWAKFFRKYNFLVGLSLDCIEEIHNLYRLDSKGKGTYERVSSGRKFLEKYGIDYNIVSVLTENMAEYPERVFEFLEKEDIKWIQFIPCLPPAEEKSEDMEDSSENYSLSAESFSDFYSKILKIWHEHLKKGKYIHIQFIDAVIQMVQSRRASICGIDGNCRMQFVVESNGDVYPCDFYALDIYRAGNLAEERYSDIENRAYQNIFFRDDYIPTLCRRCNFFPFCRGGCRRIRDAVYISEDGKFCGYREFLQKNSELIADISRKLM